MRHTSLLFAKLKQQDSSIIIESYNLLLAGTYLKELRHANLIHRRIIFNDSVDIQG